MFPDLSRQAITHVLPSWGSVAAPIWGASVAPSVRQISASSRCSGLTGARAMAGSVRRNGHGATLAGLHGASPTAKCRGTTHDAVSVLLHPLPRGRHKKSRVKQWSSDSLEMCGKMVAAGGFEPPTKGL